MIVLQFLVAAVLGALAGVGASWLLRKTPRYAWPELQELEDRVQRVERSHRMLQGRLNGLHPPRAGTGSNGEDLGLLEAGQAARTAPGSRSALLSDYLRRQRGGNQ